MFGGIIEALGSVVAVRPGGAAVRLEVDLRDLPVAPGGAGALAGLARGASVAVNGACLTLAEARGTVGGFDVIPETWKLTNLSRLRVGDRVNLERALRLGDRIDGHLVQGHVDGLARIESIDRAGGEWRLWFTAPEDLRPYLVPKGSVTLDGVSLTLAGAAAAGGGLTPVEASAAAPGRYAVALIPTTLERTTLGQRRAGDELNLETDVVARIVVQRFEQLMGGAGTRPEGVTWDTLRAAGFVS